MDLVDSSFQLRSQGLSINSAPTLPHRGEQVASTRVRQQPTVSNNNDISINYGYKQVLQQVAPAQITQKITHVLFCVPSTLLFG
jgi:hypothetical protein